MKTSADNGTYIYNPHSNKLKGWEVCTWLSGQNTTDSNEEDSHCLTRIYQLQGNLKSAVHVCIF